MTATTETIPGTDQIDRTDQNRPAGEAADVGPVSAPSPGEDRWDQEDAGLYGPRGWSVEAGVWHELARCRDDLRSVGPPAPARPGPEPGELVLDADFQGDDEGLWGDDEDLGGDAEDLVLDEPEDDYTPFHDLGPQAAARLLQILPEAQLADRQNLAPTLGSLLRACARADGRVRLSGYAIGPRRPDERVTVEALWIADPDLLDMEVHDEHDEGCCCRVLWDTVRERYGLDARALPDEMRPMRRQWTHGQVGTWLWWD